MRGPPGAGRRLYMIPVGLVVSSQDSYYAARFIPLHPPPSPRAVPCTTERTIITESPRCAAMPDLRKFL